MDSKNNIKYRGGSVDGSGNSLSRTSSTSSTASVDSDASLFDIEPIYNDMWSYLEEDEVEASTILGLNKNNWDNRKDILKALGDYGDLTEVQQKKASILGLEGEGDWSEFVSEDYGSIDYDDMRQSDFDADVDSAAASAVAGRLEETEQLRRQDPLYHLLTTFEINEDNPEWNKYKDNLEKIVNMEKNEGNDVIDCILGYLLDSRIDTEEKIEVLFNEQIDHYVKNGKLKFNCTGFTSNTTTLIQGFAAVEFKGDTDIDKYNKKLTTAKKYLKMNKFPGPTILGTAVGPFPNMFGTRQDSVRLVSPDTQMMEEMMKHAISGWKQTFPTLSEVQLNWINVAPSGNCLFNALVGARDEIQKTISKDIEGQDRMRQDIVGKIDLYDPQLLKQYMLSELGIDTSGLQGPEQLKGVYTDMMSRSTVWGGQVEIILASEVLERPIILISLKGNKRIYWLNGGNMIDIEYTGPASYNATWPTPIILGHINQNHYIYALYDEKEWSTIHNPTVEMDSTSATGTGTVEAAAAEAEAAAAEAEAAAIAAAFEAEESEARQEFEEQKQEIDKILTNIKQNVDIDVIISVIAGLTRRQVRIDPQVDDLKELIEKQLNFEKVAYSQMYTSTADTKSFSLNHVITELTQFIADEQEKDRAKAKEAREARSKEEAKAKEDRAIEVNTKVTYIEDCLKRVLTDAVEESYTIVKDIFLDNIKNYVEQNIVVLYHGPLEDLCLTFHKLIMFIYTKIQSKQQDDVTTKKFPSQEKQYRLYYLYNIFKLLDDSGFDKGLLKELTKDEQKARKSTQESKYGTTEEAIQVQQDKLDRDNAALAAKTESINELLRTMNLKASIFTKFKEELQAQCVVANMDFELIGVNLNDYTEVDKYLLFKIYEYIIKNVYLNNPIYDITGCLINIALNLGSTTTYDDIRNKLIENVKSNYFGKNYDELDESYKSLVESVDLHSWWLLSIKNLIPGEGNTSLNDELDTSLNDEVDKRLEIIRELGKGGGYNASDFYAKLHEPQYPTDQFGAVIYGTVVTEQPTQTTFKMQDGTVVNTLEKFLIGAKLSRYNKEFDTSDITLADIEKVTDAELLQIGIDKEFHRRRFLREARHPALVKSGGGKRTTRPKRTKRKTNKRRTKKRKTKKRKTNKRRTQKKKKRSTKRKRR